MKERDGEVTNIIINKTKYLVTGKEAKEKVQCGKWSCGCCGKGVGASSVKCSECNGVVDIQCPACVQRANRKYVEEEL